MAGLLLIPRGPAGRGARSHRSDVERFNLVGVLQKRNRRRSRRLVLDDLVLEQPGSQAIEHPREPALGGHEAPVILGATDGSIRGDDGER
jgi:hypothetical protein